MENKMADKAKTDKANAQLRGKPRDVSHNVKIKITKNGCFVPVDPKNPTELRELDVGEVATVSVGRAAGMRGKCEIIGSPVKAT